MKNLIKTGVLLLLATFVFSCSENKTENLQEENIAAEIHNSDSYKRAYIKSVELINEQYVLNREKALKNGLSEIQISEIENQLLEVNTLINDTREYKNYELDIVDPKSIDIEEFIEESEETSNYDPTLMRSGTIFTNSTAVKVVSLGFNTDRLCRFRYKGNVALLSAHTVGTKALGDWKYITTTRFNTGMLYPTNLTFDATYTNAWISYRTSDPRGGLCNYETMN